MLKALYDYAIRHELTLPAGYVEKTVKAYILLYSSGEFQDIEMGTEEAVAAPDIGSLANGKDKSNVLVEKRGVVIPDEPTAKSRFFLDALKSGGEIEPMLSVCAKALENEETAARIRKRLDEKKIKESDRISFKVNQISILESEKTLEWWQSFRLLFRKTDPDAMSVCLITGEPILPVATTTPINGLHIVGGHARGDALICFDKNAFCSYGLKRAANAPVSEEAFAAVKVALDHLLKDAPVLAGMKFVHWYDKKIQPEEDPIIQCGEFFDLESIFEDFSDAQLTEDSMEDFTADETSARKQADCLIESVESGKKEILSSDTNYFILLLTGVGGRVMIRRYERGSYQELQDRLNQWHQDLKLTNAVGTGEIKSSKLNARLLRLLKYQKMDDNPFARSGKELAGITPTVITSILSGGPLPDAVAVRALAYIRSKMMSDEEAVNDLFGKEANVWQWLKVWLLRNRGKRNVLMENYNPNHPSAAYHSGAIMAVYEAIQNAAMKDVNVTVMQRYYSSAIQMPALVLGRLSQLSVHHLEKVRASYGRLADDFKEKLEQSYCAAQNKIPTTLNLEQQSEFALGYYQMSAELNREKRQRIAEKKAREAAANDDK
ncbi:MAG: type I-C CRISPR-associated protein Cas8c/Csd1 [Butyricicoccus sp.]